MRADIGDEVGSGREQVLGEEMRLDARQPERQPVLAKRGDRLGVGQQRRAAALVDAPGARRRHMDARVRVDQSAVVPGEQIGALGFRQKPGEGAPRLREHGAHAIEKPVDLALAAEEDPAQDQPGDTLGMGLRIEQRQRRAPRAAEHDPFGDAEFAAQPLDIGDEMGRACCRGSRRAASNGRRRADRR